MTTAVKTVQELVADLEGVRARYQSILDEHKEGAIPAEVRAQLDALQTEGGELRAEIEAVRADEDRRKNIEDIGNFLDKPQYRIPRGAGNGDADASRALMRAGWEVRNGTVYAPTSYKDRMVPMFPSGVLIDDDISEDIGPAEKAYINSIRSTFQPEYVKAYHRWLKNSVRTGNSAIGLSMLDGAEQKLILNALAEGSDTAGGFTVPPDAQAEMLVRLADKSVMRAMCRVQQTMRDMLTWPRIQANATAAVASIYSSGFVGDWVGETPNQADIDAQFGQFQVPIKKARAKTTISNDLISDSAVNILAWLAENGAQNLALVEDRQFIVGPTAGPALQPNGVSNSGAATVDVEGSTADTISNTNAAVGSAPKILDLIYALPPQYRPTARLLMSPQVEKAIRRLVDSQNRFLYTGLNGAYSGRPGNVQIEGFDVVNSQFMPDNSAVNADKKIVFGEFSAYIIAVRTQMSVVVLRERVADLDQTMLIIFDRVGGDTWNEDAFRIGIT